MSKLPDTWKEVKLKDIATFSQGLQVGVEEQVSTPIDNYVRFIRIVDYTQKNEDIRFVENKGQRYFASKSDIVMVRYGAPGLVGRGIEGIIANNLFKINLDQKIANNDFFEHLLKSSFVQNKLQSGSASTTMPAINFSTLNTVVIPLPPLEEQKKIADILSTVDKKIAFVEENINATEELKKGLMQKLLTEGIGHTEFKDSELGRIPESWEVVTLNNIITLLTDYHANGSYEKLKENVELLEKENYAVMIRTTNFENNDFENNLIYITEHAYNYLKKSKVNENDIVINKIANAGATYIMPKISKPVSLAMNLFLLKLIDTVDNKFIYLQIKKREENLKALASGTSTKTITKNDVKNFIIALAPIEEQKKIAEILSTVDNKLENLKEKKQSFEELKKGLMQKLLTGEVRV